MKTTKIYKCIKLKITTINTKIGTKCGCAYVTKQAKYTVFKKKT